MTREEFNNSVRQMSRMLYVFAFRFLKSREEAEDAVQEVFIRMWNMGKKLDGYNSIEALATTMTRNYCIDLLRKQKHLMPVDVSEGDHKSDSSPLDIMVQSESDAIIRNIISEMPDLYQEIITLHELEGLSYEEISIKTGQNINTLRVTFSRARTMIRDKYLKYFNEKKGIGNIVKKVL